MAKIYGEIVNGSKLYKAELIAEAEVLVEILSKRLEIGEELDSISVSEGGELVHGR